MESHFLAAGATICPFPFFFFLISPPTAWVATSPSTDALSPGSKRWHPRSHANENEMLPHPLSAGNLVSLVVILSNPASYFPAPRSSCWCYHHYFENDFGIGVTNGCSVIGALMSLAGRIRQEPRQMVCARYHFGQRRTSHFLEALKCQTRRRLRLNV